MDEQTLKNRVEAYINGDKEDAFPIDTQSDSSAQEKFKIRTANRLIYTYGLLRQNRKYINDFMISLRDYLLVFNTNIDIKNIEVPEDNKFAISRDEITGKYFASYQLPVYLNESFVKRSFLEEYHEPRQRDMEYDLLTDPLIYAITGFAEFKSMSQKLAVYGALNTPDGYTSLVSLPTGGGKSLITQTLAYQTEGLTIAIVPTISLALDQVRVAKKIIRTNQPDEEIFYYSSGVDSAPILKAISEKRARLLFISPEALIKNSGFVDAVKEANQQRYLKNIIIDEAHIVVDWGASFRIDYQCLESWRKKLIKTNPNLRTILLSATYERHSVEILKDFFSVGDKWIEIRCDALRQEPLYMLVESRSLTEKQNKMIELVEKLPHPMIIYVTSPTDAEDIKNILAEHGIHNTRTFTGKTTSHKRELLINQWIDDEFEIMIATSAFGVGVDKSDVRTVLHLYIPQNPNAYYQELGRGGRDKLPCLSIMCIYSEDKNITFSRINKKVLTTEKIVGRWDSMYNSPLSVRIDNYTHINTLIKPKYNVMESSDELGSDADENWNIYVLLLLRRYKLINIAEVLVQPDGYIFVVEIIDDRLRTINCALIELIDSIRTEEWNYYNDAYKLMRSAIEHKDECWSEMFFETYDKVSELCPGCRAHNEAIKSNSYEFPLKKSIAQPVKALSDDQLDFFGAASEIVVFANKEQVIPLLSSLQEKRLSVLITESGLDLQEYNKESQIKKNLLVIDCSELHNLISMSSYYYISGMVAVVYSGQEKEISKQFSLIRDYLNNSNDIRIVHIIHKNTYFESIDKVFTDLIDGPVVSLNTICSHKGGYSV
ncbi:MAG: DEAD/DEAH box helicase [Eubacteriaceae bacterium]